jgi:hypothetical protein
MVFVEYRGPITAVPVVLALFVVALAIVMRNLLFRGHEVTRWRRWRHVKSKYYRSLSSCYLRR